MGNVLAPPVMAPIDGLFTFSNRYSKQLFVDSIHINQNHMKKHKVNIIVWSQTKFVQNNLKPFTLQG